MSARNFYIMQSAVAPMQSELPCYTPLTNHRTEVHTVPLVMAADYAALEAECANLKNSLLAITARHFAESWKKRTSDAELEQYLSAGIAQLESERDALAAELAAIKGQEPVCEVSEETFSSDATSDIITCNLPIGTKLYTLPAAQEGGEA